MERVSIGDDADRSDHVVLRQDGAGARLEPLTDPVDVTIA